MPCRFILPEKAKRAEKGGVLSRALLLPAPPPASLLWMAPTRPLRMGNRLRARRRPLP
eukprot:gene48984-9292_t